MDEWVTTSVFSQALLRTVFVVRCSAWIHNSRASIRLFDKISNGEAKKMYIFLVWSLLHITLVVLHLGWSLRFLDNVWTAGWCDMFLISIRDEVVNSYIPSILRPVADSVTCMFVDLIYTERREAWAVQNSTLAAVDRSEFQRHRLARLIIRCPAWVAARILGMHR
jgi:hypothetical protein